MLYGTIPGLGRPVSRLVLGSMVFRLEPPEAWARTCDLLDQFAALGGNAVDTAHIYGRGESERALGRWLAQRGNRDQMVIITKGAHPAPDWTPRLTPAAIAADLAESLERLGTTIDLYLLHRDDPAMPVGPIVECLNEHLAAGRIRAMGASNWTPERIQEANEYAAARGLAGFAASSPNLALAVPNKPHWPGTVSIAGDRAALAWYRARQFPVLAWSSQAGGFFSGRFSPDRPEAPRMVQVYDSPGNWERLRRARELAAARGCTPVQVALAWVLHQPFPIFALIGPHSVAELQDSAGALAVHLTPEETAWLNLETEEGGAARL